MLSFCFVDVPANVSAGDLKSILESNFNIGKVSVSRVGTCASSKWTVEWATTGGDQPTITVDGTSLTGNNVSIKAVTIDDGGMFLRPIPGDMLRVAEIKPQVGSNWVSMVTNTNNPIEQSELMSGAGKRLVLICF